MMTSTLLHVGLVSAFDERYGCGQVKMKTFHTPDCCWVWQRVACVLISHRLLGQFIMHMPFMRVYNCRPHSPTDDLHEELNSSVWASRCDKTSKECFELLRRQAVRLHILFTCDDVAQGEMPRLEARGEAGRCRYAALRAAHVVSRSARPETRICSQIVLVYPTRQHRDMHGTTLYGRQTSGRR